MPPSIWQEPFVVRAYEADPSGRLSLPGLCDWLQEAAGNHASALGVATDRLLTVGQAWVLSRLQLSLERLPDWRDRLVVETWPSAENGIVAERDFVVRSAESEDVARAVSHWVVIDVARRRPVRLPTEVVKLDLPTRERAIEAERRPIDLPAATTDTRLFTVRRGDLDLNRHVNNSRYVEWALETIPEQLLESHRCSGLDVQFRAESVYGDEVEVSSDVPEKAGAEAHLRHVVTRRGDGSVLAVLSTRWRSL